VALKVVIGIGTIWNTIVDAVANLIKKIASVLPSWAGGDALKKFAKTIQGADVNLDGMNNTLKQLQNSAQDTAGDFAALRPPMQAVTGDLNAPEGFAVALDRFNSITRGQGDIGGIGITTDASNTTPTGAGVVDALNNAGQQIDDSSNVIPMAFTVGAMAISSAIDTVKQAIAARAAALAAGGSDSAPTTGDTHINGPISINGLASGTVDALVKQVQATAAKATFIKSGTKPDLSQPGFGLRKYYGG